MSIIRMEKRDKLSDIGGISSDSRFTPVFAGKGIEECSQSLFKCDGSHIRSCLCHVSPTFSYRLKRDKSSTPVKNGSDNIELFPLYGTAFYRCQGGDWEVWYGEEGLD
jgi:hypothetical protein